ncbi:MAG: hypothetical protein LBV23_07890, partial [Deltaproteobacteria bacterium]|nr:hypothetical protein [Deltaproteobacteria bacterium]
VRDGRAIYERIKVGYYNNELFQPGENPPIVGEYEISLLSWYLQSLAATKAALSAGLGTDTVKEFNHGGMMIEDPGGNLQRFFDLANGYYRPSAHFNGYQVEIDKAARGIDTLTLDMPYNHGSLLYQRVPFGRSRFLYLKLEPFGQRGLSAQETGFSAESLRRSGLSTFARKTGLFGTLKRFFTNLGQSLARIFSFNPDKKARLAKEDNLETVTPELVRNFNKLINILKDNFSHVPALANIVDIMREAGLAQPPRLIYQQGFNAAFRKVDDTIRQAQALPADTPNKEDFLNTLRNFKNELVTHSGDHSDLRTGREVILTEEELVPVELMPLTANFTEGQVSLEFKLNQNQSNVIEKHINASLATVRPSRRRFIENFYAIETSKRPANLDQILDTLETKRQENLNKHLEDFQNLAQLKIFDRAEGQGGENHLRFDSTRDPGSRLPEVIEQQIELSGNSKKLAENIRAILNHTVVDKLTSLTNQTYYVQTGRRVGTITFDGRQDYSLVRLTPQPAPGNQNPDEDEVQYELKINFQGTFEGADGGQGTVETEITVRLNHSYSSDQVNMLNPTIAEVFEAKVKYLEPTNA